MLTTRIRCPPSAGGAGARGAGGGRGPSVHDRGASDDGPQRHQQGPLLPPPPLQQIEHGGGPETACSVQAPLLCLGVWVCGCVCVGVCVCVCVRPCILSRHLVQGRLLAALFSLSLPGPYSLSPCPGPVRGPEAAPCFASRWRYSSTPPRPFGPCLAARRGRPACGPDMLTRICGPVLLTRICGPDMLTRICGPDMLTRISGPDMLTRIGAGLRVARRRRRGLDGGGGAAARGLRAGAGGVGQRGHPSSAAPGPAPRARPLPVTLVTAHLTRMLLAGSRPPEEGGGRRCVSRVDLGVA